TNRRKEIATLGERYPEHCVPFPQTSRALADLSHNGPNLRGGFISREQIVAGINILDEIARVLDIEIEALRSVRLNISSAYARAVELIAACRRQVLGFGLGT